MNVVYDDKIFVFCAFHCKQSDRMDSEVKEKIFKYLENVGALQTNKNMMDGVFEIYSNIKDVSTQRMI